MAVVLWWKESVSPIRIPFWTGILATLGVQGPFFSFNWWLYDFYGKLVGKYTLVGGWTNPIRKNMLVKLGSSYPNRCDNKKYLSCHQLGDNWGEITPISILITPGKPIYFRPFIGATQPQLQLSRGPPCMILCKLGQPGPLPNELPPSEKRVSWLVRKMNKPLIRLD